MRAKTKRRKKFCKKFSVCKDHFSYGKQLTCDHVSFTTEGAAPGMEGYTDALTFMDRGSNFRMAQPTKSKDNAETLFTLRLMKGADNWEILYSDGWDAFTNACLDLECTWQAAQPGVKHNNAIIENTNLQIVYDTKVALSTAGLPACFWPFAVVYVHSSQHHEVL